MPPPFRIGVMQLTMEPLDEMLESARVMDRAGMDTSAGAAIREWFERGRGLMVVKWCGHGDRPRA